MSSINVTVTRWNGGWELEMDEDNITQVRTLAKAPDQVRDYLDTVHPEIDHSGWNVSLRLSSQEIDERIRKSREATIAAQKAQEEAATETRAVLEILMAAEVSTSDAAALLGISSGRVSQLKKNSRRRYLEKSA